MRVLIATGLFPPESGGPATYAHTLSIELPKRGFQVDVVPFREVRKYPKIIRHIVYFIKVFIGARGADVVFALDPVSVGLPAAIAAKLFRKRFIVKVPGDYAWEQSRQRSGFEGSIEEFQEAELSFIPEVMRSTERWVAKQATMVVVPSKYLGKIVGAWGVEKKNTAVIYNSVESMTVGLKQVIRGLLKFKGELIISSGRIVPWKGFDRLITVFSSIKKRRKDVRLLIVGDGPYLEQLERHAKKLGVLDDVIFTGAVENAALLRYMRAADVFVLNTRYEGFSHTLLEAAMVGVPIVTTKIGGNPEFIDDTMNGYLVKPDDEKALEKRIMALLDSPELRAKISGAAKRKAEKFSVKRMVDETENILKKV